MSNKKNEQTAPSSSVADQRYFPGNANRVRNRTVSLPADLTRQLREMASMPMQIDRNGWALPPGAHVDGTGPDLPALDGQAALQLDPRETAQGTAAQAAALTPLIGFLVSYDRISPGEVFPIRLGRSIITGHPMKTAAQQILIPDESICFAHAILRATSGSSVEFIDQLSDSGSAIVKDGSEEPIQENARHLKHGDVIKIGQRKFHLCMIVPGCSSGKTA